jgi:hypothetical protein
LSWSVQDSPNGQTAWNAPTGCFLKFYNTCRYISNDETKASTMDAWTGNRKKARGGSIKQGAVEGAILDGFEEVRGFDAVGVGEVGDGAGDFEDAVVGAGGEGELFHGLLEELAGFGINGAVGADLGVGHAGVAGGEAGGGVGEAGGLAGAGGDDAVAEVGGGFAGFLGLAFGEGEGGGFDVEVNAVEEWSGDAGAVALDLGRGAAAFAFGVAEVAAGAWVRCPFVIFL